MVADTTVADTVIEPNIDTKVETPPASTPTNEKEEATPSDADADAPEIGLPDDAIAKATPPPKLTPYDSYYWTLTNHCLPYRHRDRFGDDGYPIIDVHDAVTHRQVLPISNKDFGQIALAEGGRINANSFLSLGLSFPVPSPNLAKILFQVRDDHVKIMQKIMEKDPSPYEAHGWRDFNIMPTTTSSQPLLQMYRIAELFALRSEDPVRPRRTPQAEQLGRERRRQIVGSCFARRADPAATAEEHRREAIEYNRTLATPVRLEALQPAISVVLRRWDQRLARYAARVKKAEMTGNEEALKAIRSQNPGRITRAMLENDVSIMVGGGFWLRKGPGGKPHDTAALATALEMSFSFTEDIIDDLEVVRTDLDTGFVFSFDQYRRTYDGVVACIDDPAACVPVVAFLEQLAKDAEDEKEAQGGIVDLMRITDTPAYARMHGLSGKTTCSDDELEAVRMTDASIRARSPSKTSVPSPAAMRSYCRGLKFFATAEKKMAAIMRAQEAPDKAADADKTPMQYFSQFNALLGAIIAGTVDAEDAKATLERKFHVLLYCMTYQYVVSTIHTHERSLMRIFSAHIPPNAVGAFETYGGHPDHTSAMFADEQEMRPSMMLRNRMVKDEFVDEATATALIAPGEDCLCNLFGRKFVFGTPIISRHLIRALREENRRATYVRGKVFNIDIPADSSPQAAIDDARMFSVAAPFYKQDADAFLNQHIFGEESPTTLQMRAFVDFIDAHNKRYPLSYGKTNADVAKDMSKNAKNVEEDVHKALKALDEFDKAIGEAALKLKEQFEKEADTAEKPTEDQDNNVKTVS